jgi:hypothetical protein
MRESQERLRLHLGLGLLGLLGLHLGLGLLGLLGLEVAQTSPLLGRSQMDLVVPEETGSGRHRSSS